MKNRSLVFLFFLLLNGVVFASTATWSGLSSSSSDWSDASNWVGNIKAALSGGDNVILAGNSRLNSHVDTAWTIEGLTFDKTAETFDITGHPLTIGSNGIWVQSSRAQLIENNISLKASQTWYTQNAPLTISGSINGNGYTLIKAGGGGAGTPGDQKYLKLSGSTANINMGDFYVNSGFVYLDKPKGVNAISGNLIINDHGFVELNSDEQIADSSNVIINDGGWLDVEGRQETINSLSGNGTVDLDAGRLIVSGSNNTTFDGRIIANESGGGGGLTKAGTGKLTLTGVSTYNGETIVKGGTLALGNNNRLSDISGLVMAGGTFSTGGFDEKMGVLTLTADSTISMGDANSVLRFDNSSKIGWNKATLTITDWSGKLNGGGMDQLRVGANGLNISQLKEIKFFNPAGLTAGLYDARLLSSGEVVPVPEPATLALGGLLMGLIAKRSRKQKRA